MLDAKMLAKYNNIMNKIIIGGLFYEQYAHSPYFLSAR